MFNIGAGEMILIALVLLIAVGPEQLPGVIRRTGRVVGQLKTMSDNLRRDFNASLDEIERATDVKGWAEAEVGELESTIESVKEATVEPFKTDFGIDGSTKVTDIWAHPPQKTTDESTTDGGESTSDAENDPGSDTGDESDAQTDAVADSSTGPENAESNDADEVA